MYKRLKNQFEEYKYIIFLLENRMSIREELIKSIESKDLPSFVGITTKPGIHVNDIVENGVLHFGRIHDFLLGLCLF